MVYSIIYGISSLNDVDFPGVRQTDEGANENVNDYMFIFDSKENLL